ncbi:MAG: cytochrome C oxidase subunit IV family protein [Chloroflexota bacterium]
MPGTKTYIVIWVALVVATIAEVAIRSFSAEVFTILAILILIAAGKAVTIALYYQHLRYESWRLSVAPIAAIIGITALALSAAYSLSMGMM